MNDSANPAETSPEAATHPSRRLRSILGGSAGNLVEWYDWYIYSAFTLYFAPVFFLAGDRTAQLLNAAAIFAVGFLMRPIGAWIMGLFGDRYGRKAALTVSVSLMCVGSILIAICPGHAEIGSLAPILLVAARMLQGLSVGGEYGASAVYLTEMATTKRRGFYSSFQYVTLIAGQLLALGVLLILQSQMSEAALEQWGWRIPFAIGGLLAVIVYFVRRSIEETPSFAALRETPKASTGGLALWRHHPRAALTVLGLTAGGTLAFYAYSTYMQKFLVNSAGFDRETATLIMTAALFLFMLLQPAAGALSDRIGRKPLMIGFGIAGAISTVPIFLLLACGPGPITAFLLVSAALVIVTGYTSINAAVKAELFPAEIRTLGVALPYAIANTIFGGTAEYIALLFKTEHFEHGFYWYVTVMISLSLIVYWRMRDTRDHSLIREG